MAFPKGPDKEQVNLRLLADPTMKRIRQLAKERNTTVTALLTQAIEAKWGKE